MLNALLEALGTLAILASLASKFVKPPADSRGRDVADRNW